MPGIDQVDFHVGIREKLIKRDPVDTSRLHRDGANPALHKPCDEGLEILGECTKSPDRETGDASGGTATQISVAPRSMPAASVTGSCKGLASWGLALVFLCFFIVWLALGNEAALAQAAKN